MDRTMKGRRGFSGNSAINLVEAGDTETVHSLLADEYDRNALAAKGLVGPLGFCVFFDVMLDVRDALLAEIITCLLTVRTPAGRIHHHLF